MIMNQTSPTLNHNARELPDNFVKPAIVSYIALLAALAALPLICLWLFMAEHYTAGAILLVPSLFAVVCFWSRFIAAILPSQQGLQKLRHLAIGILQFLGICAGMMALGLIVAAIAGGLNQAHKDRVERQQKINQQEYERRERERAEYQRSYANWLLANQEHAARLAKEAKEKEQAAENAKRSEPEVRKALPIEVRRAIPVK
jgi:hypothetical protein